VRVPKEIKILENVCEEAKVNKKISDEQLAQLEEAFGSRFTKAWEPYKRNG
jgi:hypothetical protein